MTNYLIKNKQLFNGDVRVKLEMGNASQIAFIKKVKSLAKELKKGVVVDVEMDVVNENIFHVEFDCKCGMHIDIKKKKVQKDEDIDLAFMKEKPICPNCKSKYKIQEAENGYELIVKNI